MKQPGAILNRRGEHSYLPAVEVAKIVSALPLVEVEP